MESFVKQSIWGIRIISCHVLATALSYLVVHYIGKYFEIHEFLSLSLKFFITILFVVFLYKIRLINFYKFELFGDFLFAIDFRKFTLYALIGLFCSFLFIIFLWVFSPNKNITINNDLPWLSISYIFFQGIFRGINGAIVEELLYRGIYQKAIFEQTKNSFYAIFIASFLFGLSHLFSGGSIWFNAVYAFGTFIAGVLFGIIAQHTNSFWNSAAFHFGRNMLLVSEIVDTDCKQNDENYFVKMYVDCENWMTFSISGQPIPSGSLIYNIIILSLILLIIKRNMLIRVFTKIKKVGFN